MPQAQGIPGRDAKVEVSSDGTTWTDVSGETTTVAPGGGGRMTGETYTFLGDGPIVTSGKSQPMDLTITAVYTEGVSSLFNTARAPWADGTNFYVRYSPRGGQTGETMFTTGAGRVTSLTFPSVDAASGAPIMTGLTWRGAAPTPSTVV